MDEGEEEEEQMDEDEEEQQQQGGIDEELGMEEEKEEEKIWFPERHSARAGLEKVKNFTMKIWGGIFTISDPCNVAGAGGGRGLSLTELNGMTLGIKYFHSSFIKKCQFSF